MKRLILTSSLLAFYATPALALKITNLDHVPHQVVLDSRGQRTVMEIAPDATEYMVGQQGGSLSLLPAAKPEEVKAPKGKKAKPTKVKKDSVVHMDGMLSGVVGEARSEGLPADNDYSYTIWPGGRLAVQSKMKSPNFR